MENNTKTREALTDDALVEVAGGGGPPELEIKRPVIEIQQSPRPVAEVPEEGKFVAPVLKRAYQK